MTEVVFVRHGATAWSGVRFCGRSDPPLHAEGRAAVVALATALPPTFAPGVVIVTSPLHRARETADVIAAAAGIDDMHVDDRWRETDFGIAEGCTFDELAALEPDLAGALARDVTAIDWPGGEAAAQVGARVEAAWTDLVALCRPAIVVSHAGALRHAMALARSVSPASVELLAPATAVHVEVPPSREDR